jgi:hypothetical protein
MDRFAIGLGAVLVLAVVGLAETPPAQAATASECVSENEYNAVHAGQTRSHVHAVFGTSGRRVQKSKTVEQRKYNICQVPGAHVRVTYALKAGTWRLRDKSADAA